MAAQEDLLQSAGIRPEGVIEDVHVDYNTELGRGSDATVYGGTWRAPEANVAVKVLHPLLTEPQAGGREVFLRKYGDECNRLQSLRHDNVVRFIGVTRSREGTPALVTERMDTTLRHCSQTSQLSLLEQLDILCDASAGLAYLHSRGVVHRDLTTRNVLLTTPPNRRAKLADVGLSRSLHGNWLFLNYGAALTRCPGTMSYMPPEALAEPPAYDERLDSFSFGVLMMAVIIRRDPSTASLHAARERIQDGRSEVIPEVERRASDVNAIPAHNPLLDLIKQCLDNDPKRRPSARTIHDNLHGIRTRLFPNAQRKPETDHCLGCQRSNNEVVRLNTEVAAVWSRLEHQMQTSVQTSLEKDSAIQELRARLTEAEDTVTMMCNHEQDLCSRLREAEGSLIETRHQEEDLRTRLREAEGSLMETRDQQEDLRARLAETEESLVTTRDHEKDLQVRLSEAQSIIEVAHQEASQTQEDLRTQLKEAEGSLMKTRRQEEDLPARLAETEKSLMKTCDHEQDLRVRLSEAQNIVEATRQEASRTQEAAHYLEAKILRERERSTRERDLLTAQLEQASSEMEKMKSALFLQQVYQYNFKSAHRLLPEPRVKSPFGEWKTVHTNLPDDINSRSFIAVHSNVLYVAFRSRSLGCVLYQSMDKTHWERIANPPNMHQWRGLVTYNGHLLSLFYPDKTYDPDQHLVLFEWITEDNEEKTTSWKQLPNGRCPIFQLRPAVFVVEHKLVLAGGRDKTSSLSVVNEYCLETNHWITPSSWPCLPKAVASQQAICLRDLWCLVGGQWVDNRKFNDDCTIFSVKVEKGNPLGEFDSSTVPPTPFGICSPCQVFGHVLVAGGFKSGKGPQDGVFLFDSASNAWLKMPSLNVAKYHSSLVMFKDSIVCIGGNIGPGHTWCSQVEELVVSVNL